MLGDAGIIIQQPPRDSKSEDRPLMGLDALQALRQVLIQRILRPSWTVERSTKNRNYYSLFDNSGEEVFYAIEHNYLCSRNCCADLRDFEILIYEMSTNQEVLKLRRPFRTDCCFCPWCMQTLEVQTMPDRVTIGTITQEWAICRPRFAITLPGGEILFRVLGPCCTMRCCVRELNFDVKTNNYLVNVALISHQWNGLLKGDYEESEFFGVGFQQELDTRMKALILSTCFLVNALYYQD